MPIAPPCVLIILDGWGINPSREGNAVRAAKTPFLDRIFDQYPHTRLLCSGEAVGLPPGIMGNSEVGHLNIGAGRIVYQDLLRIDQAIADGSFHHNSVLRTAMSTVALHLEDTRFAQRIDVAKDVWAYLFESRDGARQGVPARAVAYRGQCGQCGR